MARKMISDEQILNCFKAGFDCSQVVAMQWAEEFGYDEEEAARMTAAFGGGMFRGDTCGAVGGSMVVLGWKYGHGAPGEFSKKEQLMRKVTEFQQKFTAKRGCLICRELTGFDFSKPGQLEAALKAGKLFSFCPGVVQDALAVLDEVMTEEAVA